jgi:hypothetical protein
MSPRRPQGRVYNREGRPYWSVTSVLKAVAKDALINWASYAARDATRAAAVTAYGAVHPADTLGVRHCLSLDPASFEHIILTAQGRRPPHLALTEAATSTGTMVHARIEAEVKRELGHKVTVPPVPELLVSDGVASPHPAWNAYQSYLAWRRAHAVEPVAAEVRVYSDEYEFAGTADLLARVDGDLTIVDYKTSKGVYDEYLFQIAAYRHAHLEMGRESGPLGGLVLRFPKEDGDAFEAHEVPWEDQGALMEQFLAARTLWLRMAGPPRLDA